MSETIAVPATVAIASPNPEVLHRGAASALGLVQSFEVSDDSTYGLAAEELQGIKRKASSLEEQRKAITKPLDDAKAAVMNLFRGPLEVLKQAEDVLKGKMLGYQSEQRRKAEEARLAAERAAQAERDRLKAEADALAAEGRTGEAVVKQAVAEMVVAAPPAVPDAPKVAGISTRTTIEFEVTDVLALVQHVAAHPELIGLVAANETKVRAYVRGLGTAANLPGVRVFAKESLASRR